MSHTLIITAHPSSQGFTHNIAEAFKSGKLEKDAQNTVEILDLYKTDLQMGFLSYEEKSDMAKPNPVREKLQAKITAATDIVFIHPLWWMGAPAIMKNFLDNVMSAHFAFKYENGKPIGLLKGKNAHVFITCDGSAWLYRLLFVPFRTIWQLGVLGFCGLTVKTYSLFDKKFMRTEGEKTTYLEKVKDFAKR